MISTKTAARTGAIAAFACMLSTASVSASSILADWDTNTLGGIGYTFDITLTSGKTSVTDRTATDTDFVDNFGSAFNARWVGALNRQPSDILSEIVFDTALPTGAALLVIDVDFQDETFVIDSDQGILSLLAQGETLAGENSELPTYDRGTGELVENTTTGNNTEEFSAFDLSGVTELSLHYLFGGATAGARFTFAIPAPVSNNPNVVPLPASMPLALVGLAGFGMMARRKRS